jgi:hypothetical protein
MSVLSYKELKKKASCAAQVKLFPKMFSAGMTVETVAQQFCWECLASNILSPRGFLTYKEETRACAEIRRRSDTSAYEVYKAAGSDQANGDYISAFFAAKTTYNVAVASKFVEIYISENSKGIGQ